MSRKKLSHEKTLLTLRKNLLRKAIDKLPIYAGFVIFWIFLLKISKLWSVLVWVIVLLLAAYDLFVWYRTKLLITDSKIVKFVQQGPFTNHIIEMKLDQITEIVASQRSIIDKIIWVWDIKFVWKDDNTFISFKGLKNPEKITTYVSKLKDYLEWKISFLHKEAYDLSFKK